VSDPDDVAWRDDLFRKRFEEDLRTLGIVHAVISARAELGFLHARLLAPEIGHAGGPHLLGFDRCQQADAVQRMLQEPGLAQSHELVGEVRPLDEVLHAMHAGVSEIDDRLSARDQTDASAWAGGSRKSAQFHGTHFSTSNPFSETACVTESVIRLVLGNRPGAPRRATMDVSLVDHDQSIEESIGCILRTKMKTYATAVLIAGVIIPTLLHMVARESMPWWPDTATMGISFGAAAIAIVWKDRKDRETRRRLWNALRDIGQAIGRSWTSK
jgi:hypothetical protein